MLIRIDKLRIDGGTQPRSEIDYSVVNEYADAMTDGDKFPSVVVFNDGANYWLADGFHRYHACKKLTFKEIDCNVQQGTKRDAVLYSVSANYSHGLRRSNADKRKAVLTLLEDEEWSKWSDRAIADHCLVHHDTVGKYRSELSGEKRQIELRKVKRGNQEYEMKTDNIGKAPKKEEQPASDEPEKEVERVRPEKKGVGLQKAHEAIAVLKQIPLNDDLLQEGYDIVIQWINFNRQNTKQ